MEQTASGQIRVYQRPPNVQVILALADRILGRVPNRLLHGGEAGTQTPLPLVIVRPNRES